MYNVWVTRMTLFNLSRAALQIFNLNKPVIILAVNEQINSRRMLTLTHNHYVFFFFFSVAQNL